MKQIFRYSNFILLIFATHLSMAQYNSVNFSWNINAYENLTFTSSQGYKMPYRLLKPKSNNASLKYPLVIMLHGKGEGLSTQCTKDHGPNVCNLGWGGKMHL